MTGFLPAKLNPYFTKMVREYCDICENEIRQGEHVANFASLEPNLNWKKNQPYAPAVSKYVLCENCAKEVKMKIAEMVTTAKKNVENRKTWNLKT